MIKETQRAALVSGKNRHDAYDPFPWYEKMRKESPVYYDEENEVWSVFLYDDVKRVLSDKEYFSSQGQNLQAKGSLAKSMISMDPPNHTRIRSIVNRAFTPRVMKEWEPRIQEIANELLAKVHGREKIDLVRNFSYPLPVMIIAEMLGVPSEHMDRFKEWSDIIVSMPKDNSDEEVKKWNEIRDTGEEELNEFFQAIIEEKKRHLGNDIISILIQAEQEAEKLTADELIPFCNLLLVAGNETTTNLISNAVYSILEKPGTFDELRNQPDLIPKAIEEALRFRAPAPVTGRIVKQDVEMGDARLKKGEGVLAFIASANRDETVFDRPREFDIHRTPNPHIAFGHGIHFCLGAPLARLEAKIALTALLNKFASMEKISIEPIANSAIYGLQNFHVRVR